MRLNWGCSMLKSQVSITTLSIFDQPAGSSSRRASDMNVQPGLSHSSRLTISPDVVPPTAMSAPRTTSSIESFGMTGMPSVMRPFLRERLARLGAPRRAADFRKLVHGREAAQRIRPHGADTDKAEHLGIFRADPLAGDGGGCGAAHRIAPVLVNNGERLAAMRVGERDVARTVESTDRVAYSVVVIVVDADAGRRNVLEERRLDVPMVVEVLRHVELEAVRVRPHHGAARVHAIDVLADLERVLDAQKSQRIRVRDEQNAFVVGHPAPLPLSRMLRERASLVQHEIHVLAGRRVDFEDLEHVVAQVAE